MCTLVTTTTATIINDNDNDYDNENDNVSYLMIASTIKDLHYEWYLLRYESAIWHNFYISRVV